MPRTAQSIIARALQIAKAGNLVNGVAQGYTAQALDELNSISDHLCDTLDLSAARGTYNFTFNTTLTTAGSGNIISAAAQTLPLDYLRVPVSAGATGAQRSSKYYINGVPYDMVEIDLTEWDDQVQQAGIQSYPYFWAKDISQRVLVLNTTADLTSGSTTIANLASTAGIAAGMSVAGTGMVAGATVVSVNVGAASAVLSAAATATVSGASLMFGYPPVAYPYPPPSGAFPAMIRYQRVMPPLTQVQVNAGAFFWFDDDAVVMDLLCARLSKYTDDSRVAGFEAEGQGKLAKYMRLADDNANRAQSVQLDRRTFGIPFSLLKNTKRIGW